MLIQQAARRSGLAARTIRYYEAEGVLPAAPRAANGYRDYSEEDVRRLLFLSRARRLGFGMRECRKLVALSTDPTRPSRDVKALALRKIEAIDRQIDELAALRRQLAELAGRCRGNDEPACPILDELDGRHA